MNSFCISIILLRWGSYVATCIFHIINWQIWYMFFFIERIEEIWLSFNIYLLNPIFSSVSSTGYACSQQNTSTITVIQKFRSIKIPSSMSTFKQEKLIWYLLCILCLNSIDRLDRLHSLIHLISGHCSSMVILLFPLQPEVLGEKKKREEWLSNLYNMNQTFSENVISKINNLLQ